MVRVELDIRRPVAEVSPRLKGWMGLAKPLMEMMMKRQMQKGLGNFKVTRSCPS